jgi:hypothetical protein
VMARKADKRVAGGGKTAKGESAACLLLLTQLSIATWSAEPMLRSETRIR